MTPTMRDIATSLRTVWRVLAVPFAGASFPTLCVVVGFDAVRAVTGLDDGRAFLPGQPLGILVAVLKDLRVTAFRRARRERLRHEATRAA